MEDYQCFVDHYCYSTRIDLPPNSPLVLKWVTKYKMKYYCLVHEYAPKTNKSHYQGIVWFGEKDHKRARNAREWWNGKLRPSKKGDYPFSFTTCYSTCEQLARYCLKEVSVSKHKVTNLTPEMLVKLRMFKTKKERVQDKKNKLERKLTLLTHNSSITFESYCHEYMNMYSEVYGQPPRNRIQYYQSGLRYNIINKTQYLKAIGVDIYVDQNTYPYQLRQELDQEIEYSKNAARDNIKLTKQNIKLKQDRQLRFTA